MITGKLLVTGFAALLLSAAAPPVSAAEPPWVEARDEMMTPLGMTAGELEGARLHGEDGAVLGEIDEVLATRDGQVAGLAVEIEDGALGLGDREVVLRFDQVRRQGDRITTLLSRAQLEAQPSWDD